MKIDLVEGSRCTQIHIHPFLTRAGTHPCTVEILRRSNQLQFFPLVKVPIAECPILCTFHFQADAVEGIICRLGQRKCLVQYLCRLGAFLLYGHPTLPVIRAGKDCLQTFGHFVVEGNTPLEDNPVGRHMAVVQSQLEINIIPAHAVLRIALAVEKPFAFVLQQIAGLCGNVNRGRLFGRKDTVGQQLRRQIVVVAR
ncbi:hypothetical protein Barb6_01185 [Bacteroidales bacterium Barb6]|nr:hypothetical protein Barb6_01185 [Bacteroidales bacterium Barb6]